MHNASTYDQARQKARGALDRRGQSVQEFAKQHHLNPSTVYAVLSGQSRGRRGEAHRAAVLLGIKDGLIARSTPKSSTNPKEINLCTKMQNEFASTVQR